MAASRSTRSSRSGCCSRSASAILPLYLLLRQLGLLDTALGVALPEAAFGLPITIVILRPFMRAIPTELEDAAAIDGCSRFGFFWRILLPLSRPALITVAILAVVTSWNMFLLPLLVLNDQSEWTLPLGVAAYSTEYTQDTARDSRVHGPVDGARARVLPLRRAPDRRRPLRRGQGMSVAARAATLPAETTIPCCRACTPTRARAA